MHGKYKVLFLEEFVFLLQKQSTEDGKKIKQQRGITTRKALLRNQDNC